MKSKSIRSNPGIAVVLVLALLASDAGLVSSAFAQQGISGYGGSLRSGTLAPDGAPTVPMPSPMPMPFPSFGDGNIPRPGLVPPLGGRPPQFNYAPRQLGGGSGCVPTETLPVAQVVQQRPQGPPAPPVRPAQPLYGGPLSAALNASGQASQGPEQPAAQAPAQQPSQPQVQQQAAPALAQQLADVARRPEPEDLSRIEAAFNVDALPASPFRPMVQGAVADASPAPSPSPFPGLFGAPLRQYGYTLFAADVSTFAPVDDVPVGPDYVLGPGDDLTIYVWGPIDTTVVRTVDRDGRIVLPKVGDLRVWGLSFSEADRLIREQLARYFRGFQTSVSMGRLRTIRVQVVGEVCKPGAYMLSSLTTLTNALYAAGGPTKLGSLRQIRLLRNHHMVGTLDLYDFMLRGDRISDFRLESGDTIFVPTIGDVAAVTGEVKRPAIYEIRGEARLADLIDMAGGVTPSSYLRRVQIVRAQPSAERITVDVDMSQYYLNNAPAANPLVRAGDLVLIHRSDARIYNTVKVEGAVKYPGIYESRPMMRISQLLPTEKLLPEAFPDRVEIARRAPDFSMEILSVNLRKAWAGDQSHDLLLQPLDEVTVRTEMRDVRTVTLTGQVVRPGRYVIAEGERLSSVLQRAGGFTDKAYLKSAVFTRAPLRKVEQEQLELFVRFQEQRILADAAGTLVGADKDDALLEAQAIQARRDLLKALASRVAVGRMVVRLDTPERLRGSEHDIALVDGDTLDVPEPPSSVLVLGAVRNPTSVQYKRGESIEYYLNRVGGLSTQADKKEIHLVKADGSAAAGFSKIREVEPGDTVLVPAKVEDKIRFLGVGKDILQTIGATLISIAALTVLF